MNILRLPLLSFVLLLSPSLLAAESNGGTGSGWHAQSLSQALIYMLLFAASGIVIAIAGYKLFDLFTPGDLHKEIVEKQNVAAAIVAGAVVLGICLIIAAAMMG